jgi:hypothetical protein
LADFLAADFLADFFADFFAELLVLFFLTDLPSLASQPPGSAVAGPNKNLKYEERWCPSERPPVEEFFTVLEGLPLRVLANRAAPRALLREMVPVFAIPIIGRCSINGPLLD